MKKGLIGFIGFIIGVLFTLTTSLMYVCGCLVTKKEGGEAFLDGIRKMV